MMYGYRKERIAECLYALRNMDNRAWDGVVTWEDVIRAIKNTVETLENPDAEMAEAAQEKPEPVKRQRTQWFYRSFGTA